MLVEAAAVLVPLPAGIASELTTRHSFALLAQVRALACSSSSGLVDALHVLWEDLQEAVLCNCVAILVIVYSLTKAGVVGKASRIAAFRALGAALAALSARGLFS